MHTYNADAVNTVERRNKMGETFDFGMALEMLKAGHKVARKGWNGKDIYLELQRPDEH